MSRVCSGCPYSKIGVVRTVQNSHVPLFCSIPLVFRTVNGAVFLAPHNSWTGNGLVREKHIVKNRRLTSAANIHAASISQQNVTGSLRHSCSCLSLLFTLTWLKLLYDASIMIQLFQIVNISASIYPLWNQKHHWNPHKITLWTGDRMPSKHCTNQNNRRFSHQARYGASYMIIWLDQVIFWKV